jgi:hypothetical protein
MSKEIEIKFYIRVENHDETLCGGDCPQLLFKGSPIPRCKFPGICVNLYSDLRGTHCSPDCIELRGGKMNENTFIPWKRSDAQLIEVYGLGPGDIEKYGNANEAAHMAFWHGKINYSGTNLIFKEKKITRRDGKTVTIDPYSYPEYLIYADIFYITRKRIQRFIGCPDKLKDPERWLSKFSFSDKWTKENITAIFYECCKNGGRVNAAIKNLFIKYNNPVG